MLNTVLALLVLIAVGVGPEVIEAVRAELDWRDPEKRQAFLDELDARQQRRLLGEG